MTGCVPAPPRAAMTQMSSLVAPSLEITCVEGSLLVSVCVVSGLTSAGAIGLTRFLGRILYETEPLDPWTFATMAAVLFAVALAASFVPARRAAAVSPLQAMRDE